MHALLGMFAASLGSRNPTADALHGQLGGSPRPVTLEVPFSSRWKWSGIAFGDGTELVLGAPEVIVRPDADPALAHEVGVRQDRRLRVLLFARTTGLAEPEGDAEPRLPALTPLALVALSERMRPDAATTVAYLHRTGVHVKIISGDGPATVAAVARAAGIDTDGRVTTGAELPQDAGALRRSAIDNAVFARVQPEDKRQLVAALRRGGRRVGMIGDGVNDVPALKECDVAIALGSGSQLAKGVADVVLVSESFESIPFAIEEGRKILRNVQRVAKLFVAKSVFAALLILTVGVGGGTYPFLPRQLSLAAAFTVGIPAFFLALAPAAQAPPKPFLRDVAEFAIPAGLILGIAVLLGHGLVHTSIGRSAAESRDDVADDPRLRGPLPRARARVGQHAALAPARRARPPARGGARHRLPAHSRVPGDARRLRARGSVGTPRGRQRHLHDVRDRGARPARPVADAARRRAGAGRALLATRGASALSVCDNRPFRGVAQPGSALRSGRRGPQFESGHPDALPGPQRAAPAAVFRSQDVLHLRG